MEQVGVARAPFSTGIKKLGCPACQPALELPVMMPLRAGRSAECLQDGTDHVLSIAVLGTMDD